jgi:hypothetical protein
MKANQRQPPRAPFTVVCEVCGWRMELGSHEDAPLAGWTEIRSLPNCVAADFVGLCSGCCRFELEAERL